MTTAERLQHFLTRKPDIAAAAFVATDAQIIGDVRLGKDSSVFYGAVLRGDIESIHIGEATNVQDGCIIHLADDLGARVGAWCTIGHAAIIHACTVGDECLVGMKAVILDGAEIGDQCLIAAGALVTQRMKIPPRSMVMGTPAKVVRTLNAAEIVALRQSAEKYKIVAAAHAALQKQSI
ncbi:gamma carbonic anhydrase family protein [bacterium]|jgi:carbonic anhydrase/acetyltransferase-like protein (isoleucine patch superfamily)|nr:gamma carbonic anhydrase family protein [bacterium]NBS51869.1 gamma carbonic anhydrase family protein [Spartobacteria bacterium]